MLTASRSAPPKSCIKALRITRIFIISLYYTSDTPVDDLLFCLHTTSITRVVSARNTGHADREQYIIYGMRYINQKNRSILREMITADFKVRYQGSVLGYLWSLLRPLFLFAILYVV